MAIWNRAKKITASIPDIGMNAAMRDRYVKEAADDGTKGQVATVQTINKDLGEPHPFDYALITQMCKEYAFAAGLSEKILNAVWGAGFSIKCKDQRGKAILDQWCDDTNFKLVGRAWVKQAIRKGFSPLELGGDGKGVPKGIKVLNADRVFVKRDDKGSPQAYNQLKPNAKGMSGKDSIIPFNTNNIMPLHINRFEDEPYGTGLLYPLLKTFNNLIGAETAMHRILKRKSNTPLVATLGVDENTIPTQDAVDDLANKMTYMQETTEWAVPFGVKLEALNFGDVGQKFQGVLDHDADMIFFGSNVPEVIMGRGNIPEGLAQTQGEEWHTFVGALQMEIEPCMEELFERILLANTIKEDVDFVWGTPTESQTNTKITQISALLQNIGVSPQLHFELEKKLATIFDIDESKVTPPETEKKQEEGQPQPKVPGRSQNQFIEGELHLE